MGWEWIIHSDGGPSVGPFLGEYMLFMDQEKNEPHHFFEAFIEMWNHIAHKMYKYADMRITQRCK